MGYMFMMTARLVNAVARCSQHEWAKADSRSDCCFWCLFMFLLRIQRHQRSPKNWIVVIEIISRDHHV